MSTISQRIPYLFGGISQQPDIKKRPGEVRDSTNAYPDYALGMLKRPGGKHVASLENAAASGRWFSILRDASEKYVGQFANEIFRIWSITDGQPRKVDMGSTVTYPGTCNQTTVGTALATYRTAQDDTAAKLDLLHTAQADYAEKLAGQTSTVQSLFAVNYNYPGGAVEQYLTSGILKTEAGVFTVKNADTVVAVSSTLPTGYALGTELTEEHPLLASQGYRVYQAHLTVAATSNSTELTAATTAMNTAQTNYNNAVTAEATAKTAYNTAITNCNISATPATSYLKDATADDIEFLTLNDYTLVLNKSKEVALTSTTEPAQPHQAQVVINVVAYNSTYSVTLGSTTFSHTTPNDTSGATTDGGTIAAALATAIDADASYSATQVGPSVYISSSSAFSLEVKGGSQQDGIYGFQDEIPNVSRLPLQSKNGYVVKIANSTDLDIDDMYVKFETSNGQNYGVGSWVETRAPGIKYEFDLNTMPHVLVRLADGSFYYGQADGSTQGGAVLPKWTDRLVGDDTTNPLPSFVGNKISHLFFHRNRLGVLSNDAVVMSKAGDFFNFFVTSAQVTTNDDPIDISASATRPVFLNYVLPSSVGLVLYGTNEQFILSTDSDILSPTTAKVNTLSNYESDSEVRAVSLGTTQAFISKTPVYARLFELFEVSDDRPPLMRDNTQSVPELVPQTVDNLIASPGLSMVSLATSGSSTVYQYKFFQQGDQRAVSTWYKWDLTGKLLDQFFDDSTYYAVTYDGSNVYVKSYDMNQSSESGFLTLPTGEKTDVCLDLWNVNPYRTYDTSTKKTRVFLPYEKVGTEKLTVVILGGYIGSASSLTSASVGATQEETVAGSAGGYYVDIDGDYRGRDLIIGYTYDMSIKLPEFYVYKQSNDQVSNDVTSNLILHRLNVSTGLSGPVTYKVNITGIPSYNNTVSVTLPNTYSLNNVNLQAEAIHVVPIHQRNKNVSVEIFADSAFPVSILGIDWEGKYTKRFYTRAS